MLQVSVEKVTNVLRRLVIVLPAEQVKKAYDEQLNQFAKVAKLKGFRPGKAPQSHIEQVYGAEIRKETISDLIEKSLKQAFIDENLQPVNPPQMEPLKKLGINEPLEFAVSFEVLPEINQIQFSMENVNKFIVNITPEDIDQVIEQLKKQHTKWNLVGRPAKEGDRVVIDYHSIYEGKADLDNKVVNFPFELGSKVMLPGFEEGLLGAKEGEERTLHLSFPADFSVAEKAGKSVDFVVSVKQIFEANPPQLDEKFIHDLGINSGTVDEFRNQIAKTLERERDRLVTEKLKEQVFSKLLEQNSIDVPNSLIDREAKAIHDEIYTHQHDHHKHSDEETATFRDIAKKRVALGLLIAEYAKQFQVKADKSRIAKRIEDIAANYNQPQEVIKWLSSPQQQANIEAQILEDQVLEKLVESVSVVEKQISYDELKSAHKPL